MRKETGQSWPRPGQTLQQDDVASARSREEGMALSLLPLTTETASKSKAAEAAVQHLKL